MQGFPPKFPPTMEERQGVTMDQPVTIDTSLEGVPVIESEEEYSSLENLSASTSILAQLPPSQYSTFHIPIEGHSGAQYWVFSPPSDDPVALKFGPIAPFWETSLGRTISKYDTTTLTYAIPPTDL